MNTIYLLLGSNIGDSKAALALAKKNIEKKIGRIEKSSSVYKTAAWGNTDQPDFLNAVVKVSSSFNAEEALHIILETEHEMGRIRTEKNAPRIIDIDILFFNNDIISSKRLTVPHREIQNRLFVLIPLAELAPDYMHPLLQKTVKQLLAACKDQLNVQKI